MPGFPGAQRAPSPAHPEIRASPEPSPRKVAAWKGNKCQFPSARILLRNSLLCRDSRTLLRQLWGFEGSVEQHGVPWCNSTHNVTHGRAGHTYCGLSWMLPFLQLNPEAQVQLCPVSQWKIPRVFPTSPPWGSLAGRTTCSTPSPGITTFQRSPQLPLNSSKTVGAEGVTPVVEAHPPTSAHGWQRPQEGHAGRRLTRKNMIYYYEKTNKTQLCCPEALSGQKVQGMHNLCHDLIPAWCCLQGWLWWGAWSGGFSLEL